MWDFSEKWRKSNKSMKDVMDPFSRANVQAYETACKRNRFQMKLGTVFFCDMECWWDSRPATFMLFVVGHIGKVWKLGWTKELKELKGWERETIFVAVPITIEISLARAVKGKLEPKPQI